MQNPQGQVLSLRRDGAALSALLEVDAQAVCRRCESGKGCGAGLLGRSAGSRQLEATVANGLQLAAGDRVSLVLAPRHVLRAALLVYGLPLSAAVLAALLSYVLELGDLLAALASVAGLAAGILVARQRLSAARCLRDFTPVVTDKLSAAVD